MHVLLGSIENTRDDFEHRVAYVLELRKFNGIAFLHLLLVVPSGIMCPLMHAGVRRQAQ
jgi:hypothetical protein